MVATQTFFFFTLEPWGIMIQIWQIAYHLNSQEPGTCLGPGCCWGGLRAILSCCGTSWKCGEPQHLEHWIVYTTFNRYTNGFLQSTTFLGHVLCVFFPANYFQKLFLLDSFWVILSSWIACGAGRVPKGVPKPPPVDAPPEKRAMEKFFAGPVWLDVWNR